MNTVDTALPNWVCIPDEEPSHLTTYKAGENGFGACPDHEIAGGCSIPEEPFKALILSLTNEAELRGRMDSLSDFRGWVERLHHQPINESDRWCQAAGEIVAEADDRLAALLKLSGASSRINPSVRTDTHNGKESAA